MRSRAIVSSCWATHPGSRAVTYVLDADEPTRKALTWWLAGDIFGETNPLIRMGPPG